MEKEGNNIQRKRCSSKLTGGLSALLWKSESSRIKQRVKSIKDRSYPNQDDEGNYRTDVIEKKDSGGYKRDTMKFEILGYTPRDGKRWQIGESTARELESKNRFIWDGEKIY